MEQAVLTSEYEHTGAGGKSKANMGVVYCTG